MVTAKKIILKANHQMICQSELAGGRLPPDIACFFSPSPGLPKGIRLHAFVSEMLEDGMYNLVITNDTSQPIRLPRGFPLGAIYYKNTKDFQTQNSNSSTKIQINSMTTINPSQAPPSIETLFDSVVPPNLKPSVYLELKQCILSNKDLFAFTPKELGTTVLIKHEIQLLEPGPIRMRPYPVAFKHRELLKRHLEDMLEGNIIQHSTSAWAAPVVLADKKDNSKRFCVDFRRLNAITKKDSFPLPRIEDLLDSLRGQKLFTTLDLAAGFWQIELTESSREKTAFVVDHNLYEFLRLPFGLTNAPGTFQRLMNHVLREVIGHKCLVYLDDIIIFGATVEQHLQNLQEIFNLLRIANLKLKLSKCKFLQERVQYLGHIVDETGITPDPAKVECIKNFPRPKTVQDLQSFIGLASYYRRFIPDFGTISHFLVMQTSGGKTKKGKNPKPQRGKDDPISWGPDEINAFETLKLKLSTEPVVLLHPNFSKEFLIFTDASNYGVGCVLSQLQDDGAEQVVAYASRHLNEAERKYPAIEREGLAVMFGIRKFRHYLLDNPFTVISDHRPLQWLSTFKDTNGRVGRWAVELSGTKYTIRYRPGRVHENADCLSRIRSVRACNKEDDFPLLAIRQAGDHLCQQIIDYMDNGELSELHRKHPPIWVKEIQLYTIVNGVLLRHYAPSSSKRRHIEQLQAVVPYSLQKDILEQYHDSPQGGHFGYFKTAQKIREHYYWPDMLENIKEYCHACVSCAKNRKVQPRAHLLNIETPYIPFHTIGIDFLGPIKPHNRQINNHILVITCYFTKWVELVALPNQTAETTSRAIMKAIVNRFGMPRVIISDNGPNFASKLFNELCKLTKAKHKFNTPYHPQTSGLTERFNRTLIAILRNYIDAGHTNWEEMLDYVAFAYRGSIHKSTLETPYYLVHGRDPVMLLDHILGHKPESPITPNSYAQQALKRLNIAYRLVKQNTRDARIRQKELYDKRAKTNNYQVGDKVLKEVVVVKHGLSKKFTAKYVGPYRILEILSELTVRIQAEGVDKSEIIHVNRIKPLFETQLWKDEPCDPYDQPEIENDFTNNRKRPDTLTQITSQNNKKSVAPPIPFPRLRRRPTAATIIEPETDKTETPTVASDANVETHPKNLELRPEPKRDPRLRSRALLRKSKSNKYPTSDYILDSIDENDEP